MHSQLLFPTLGCDVEQSVSELVISACRSFDNVAGTFRGRHLLGILRVLDDGRLAWRHCGRRLWLKSKKVIWLRWSDNHKWRGRQRKGKEWRTTATPAVVIAPALVCANEGKVEYW